MNKGRKTFILAAFFGVAVALGLYLYFSGTANDRLVSTDCNNGQSKHNSLGTSKSPQLRKLAEYEAVCVGAVVDSVMFFTVMPSTQADATSLAEETAGKLKEFSDRGIKPFVVFEPNIASPAVLSMIKNDAYNQVLVTYYQTLKNLGINDEQMGTWVLFPEANTPTWRTTSPTNFVTNVTKVATIQKLFFPSSKVSILLNSRTYPDNDWSRGQLKSLTPYVADIPKGLLDSFGYQGFPSVSPAGAANKYRNIKTPDFLPIGLVTEAAKKLGLRRVWLNTGTFKSVYTNNPTATVNFDTRQREMILDSIVQQAKQLQSEQFTVSINLFAADKSNTGEHIDWSYWQPHKSTESEDTRIFKEFVHQIRAENVGFSLYDSEE